MPLPVIPYVFQCRLIWSSSQAPRNASNNLYFKDLAGTAAEVDVFNALDASVTDTMWSQTAGNAKVSQVIVTKLDGLSAGVIFPTGGPTRWTAQGGDIILQGCQVVTIRTLTGGRSFRGRIYLPWVGESEQTNGMFDAAGIASVQQPAWDTFRAAMETANMSPVVVSPLLVDDTQVAAYVCRGNVTTQRRRAIRSV